jgi:hypothetical protein
LREVDVVGPPLVPFLYPESLLQQRQRRGAGRYAAGTKSCQIPEDRWPEIIARDFGVSHETIRAIVGRIDSREGPNKLL